MTEIKTAREIIDEILFGDNDDLVDAAEYTFGVKAFDNGFRNIPEAEIIDFYKDFLDDVEY